jgi:hypothetical protein
MSGVVTGLLISGMGGIVSELGGLGVEKGWFWAVGGGV